MEEETPPVANPSPKPWVSDSRESLNISRDDFFTNSSNNNSNGEFSLNVFDSCPTEHLLIIERIEGGTSFKSGAKRKRSDQTDLSNKLRHYAEKNGLDLTSFTIRQMILSGEFSEL